MRRVIQRTAGAAILAATLVVGIPAAIALWWVTDRRPDLVEEWLRTPDSGRAVQVVVGMGLVLSVSLLVGWVAARRASASIAGPLESLVETAERLGEADAPIRPLTTGIAEVDRISEVLARADSRLARALATERSFASDASHQLRTPLTALLMRIDEIAQTDDLEVAHEEAAIAIAQVERLSAVVDDLLRRRRAGPEGALPEVSIDSVIAGLQREWQPAFETARRSVRVHGERGLMVRATPVAVTEVLSTLIENALVHGRGTVDVQARRSGPSVVVEVRDEGTGVPATIAPHIFERSVSSAQEGTGVGLALARDLAESCGGRLDLVSMRPATFALFLSEARGGRSAVR